MYEDQIAEVEGVTEIARILQRKLVGKYNAGFNAITDSKPKKEKVNPYITKNVFLGMSVMLNGLIR